MFYRSEDGTLWNNMATEQLEDGDICTTKEHRLQEDPVLFMIESENNESEW